MTQNSEAVNALKIVIVLGIGKRKGIQRGLQNITSLMVKEHVGILHLKMHCLKWKKLIKSKYYAKRDII